VSWALHTSHPTRSTATGFPGPIEYINRRNIGKGMASVVGAALPLLAPQSFAQGTLERRVAFTKDTGFLQSVC
jgi:hypothetical protein